MKCVNFARITIITEYSALIFPFRSVQIMMNTGDKVPGIVIYSNYCMAKGYFDIVFCPMCGRKLVEE